MGNIKAFFGNPYYLMTTVLAIAAFGFAASAIISLIQERRQKKEVNISNKAETDSEELEKKLGVDSKKLRKFLRVNEKKSNLKPQETTEGLVEENEIHSEITEKFEKVETSPVSIIDTEPEELNPTDVAEFQSRMIEHFRRKDTLQQSLIELLDIYESGPIYNFDTTLDILFAGMDAETLKADLLRMEILRYRRLPYHNAEKNSAVLD